MCKWSESEKMSVDSPDTDNIEKFVENYGESAIITDSVGSIEKFVMNNGDIPLMKKMLEERVISDVNIRHNGNGWADCTALMYQTYSGTVEGMEFLLAHQPPALPNLETGDGYTALHWAVWKKDGPAKVRHLLDYGADKEKKCSDGETALDIARIRNFTECIKVLESYTPNLRG